VEVFENSEWNLNRIPPIPIEYETLRFFSALVIENQIYIFGGRLESDTNKVTTDKVWKYKNNWEPETPLHLPIRHHK